ncbi:ssrA-binding protein [Neorickettsia helminthoeca str. Oregon]|uniref:SsrA-binding protein n=1 Tax=Neorickettsia helminthoeca str. Oregon TaxID=1286528 RepID=X5HMJ9_9RICK|nr:SsrA-binding protein SmpB [Neorickettsia helminthoeca]AHX11700.1 ssrA-binding protein [Neorickettsia helminthoeca str. Oregon]
MKIIAVNKKARFDYSLADEFEAGIVLLGTEVKSLKYQSASLNEAFVAFRKGELWLNNMHVPHYKPASRFNHVPTRSRKLLVHKRQLNKISGIIKMKGLTLVVLSIYVNDKGLIKLKFATARGKKKYDKRQDIKDRDWERKKARQDFS